MKHFELWTADLPFLKVQIPAERRSHSEMNGMYIPT